MSHHGEALGVELGTIYKYGRENLPQLSAEMLGASIYTPRMMAHLTVRGGGLGVDPGPGLEQLANHLFAATESSATVLGELADRMVHLAEDYKETDAKAKQKFDSMRKQVDTDVTGGQL